MTGILSRGITYLKRHVWLLVVALDLLIFSCVWLGKWFLTQMLAIGKPCRWTLFGAQCATCGGTRCIACFLRGDFIGAFSWNPMVFCWVIYAILTAIMLNLRFLCKQEWAATVLRRMYSLPVLYIAIGVYLVFPLIRNLPLLFALF